MNKILSITLLFSAALAFTACTGEEDDLFDKSAAERLEESKVTYTERFAANGGKWVMEYYPTNGNAAPQGKGYLMLLEFSTKGWVRIAMNNEMSDNQYKESTSLWKMIADQGPVLSFCTYNDCLHFFSDPAIYDTGLGYEGDYEFEVLRLPVDATEAMLKGKKRGTYIRLSALPADTDFEQYLSDVNAFVNRVFPPTAVNPVYVLLGDSIVESGNMGSLIADMFPKGGDAISQTTSHPFLVFQRDGQMRLRFRDNLTNGDDNYQEYIYREDMGTFTEVDGRQSLVYGPNPNEFYASWMTDGHKWNLDLNETSMSEALTDAYNAVATRLKALTYTIQTVVFTMENGDVKLSLSVRNSKKQSLTVSYLYTLTPGEDNVTLSYREPFTDPKSTQAATMLNNVPQLQSLLDAFSGTFTVQGADNPLSMNTIVMSNGSNITYTLNSSK